MANGFIQVPADSTGKKLQTFENTVGANTVEAEAVVLVDNTGANACNVNGSGQLPVAVGNTPSVNQGTSPWLVRENDGTNSETQLFDADSSGVTHQYVQGVSLRKSASGGSVELGTSSNPVRTDPTGTTTQPVSGTVTANIGTSGSLALDASVTGLQVAQGSTTSGEKGPMVQGAVTTNAPTYTTAQTDPLSLDTSGNLRVSLKDSPANTNKFLVTADPITFASAQAVTQSGTWTVQPGNTANTTPWLVQDVGQATGGMSFFTQSLTSTKAQVKGSGGTIYGITAVNNGSALAYVQVFNKLSANVTVGTTAPDYVVPVPAPSSGTAGAGIREEYSKGLAFGTGITVACTTTRTGSTSATCDVNVNYI